MASMLIAKRLHLFLQGWETILLVHDFLPVVDGMLFEDLEPAVCKEMFAWRLASDEGVQRRSARQSRPIYGRVMRNLQVHSPHWKRSR